MQIKCNTQTLSNFIVIEGIDGSGTTTQSRLLVEELTKRGQCVEQEHEPTDDFIGKNIRKVLQGEEIITSEALAYLYAADRWEHLFAPEKGIVDRLNAKKTIVSDRYFFSSLAYQSLAVDFDLVMQLNQNFPLPEHFFLLDLPAEDALERVHKRNSQVEIFEEISQQKFFRNQFLEVAKNYQKLQDKMNIHIIDARLDEKEVHELILTSLKSKL